MQKNGAKAAKKYDIFRPFMRFLIQFERAKNAKIAQKACNSARILQGKMLKVRLNFRLLAPHRTATPWTTHPPD